MSEQTTTLLAGAVVGILGTIIGAFVNYWLTIRRDRELRKLEQQQHLRKTITAGASELALRPASTNFRQPERFKGELTSIGGKIVGDVVIGDKVMGEAIQVKKDDDATSTESESSPSSAKDP